jgi:hypothetical protein
LTAVRGQYIACTVRTAVNLLSQVKYMHTTKCTKNTNCVNKYT